MFDKLTGNPVDFTKVKRISFDYYLPEDCADFKGSWLYLVSEGWENILLDKNFFHDFKKGSWEHVSVNIKDLNLELVRGKLPVLPEVYEMRIDLQYEGENKNIEMWIDNFGWE